jgi:hypothetical protein
VSDRLGDSLAADDFNNDGVDDLAIGVTNEDIGANEDAGAVKVIYGTSSRLATANNQLWHQNSPSILEDNNPEDLFGSSLTTGDFNNDGFADLAVGVVGENVGTVVKAGGINVIYGSGSRLSATNNQFWHQDSPDIIDSDQDDDAFGSSLSVGDYNNDGYDDLSVGVPNQDIEAIVDAGAVNVIYGSATRLKPTGNQFWHQDVSGITDKAEDLDGFGTGL